MLSDFSYPSSFAIAAFNTSALANLLQTSRNLKDFEWSENERPTVAHNQFEHELPLIDLAALHAGNQSDRKACLSNMKQACQEWGFFQVINHGVPFDLIQQMEKQAKFFFRLPLQQKRRVLRGACGKPMGYTYGDVGTCLKNDLPWMEALQLPLKPDEMESLLWRIWYGRDEDFSSVAREYSNALKDLALRLLVLLTEELGLNKYDFSKNLEEGDNSVFRFNCYPPCPQPSLTLGLGSHSDPHVLTVLHQDEVGGLQILKDQKWIAVRPRTNSFIVNVGDALQVWSNDVYKSVEHRAVCNSVRPRLSMAFFLNPGEETSIVPAPKLVDSEHPAHYRRFTWKEYRESMYTNRPRGKSNLRRFMLQRHDHSQH